MKNWNWKQWTAFGIVVALVITFGIIHLVQPQVSYAWLEVMSFINFGGGVAVGYLLKKSTTQSQVAGDNSTQVQIGNKE